MTITINEVRAWLDAEEPDYEGAARALGDAAQPALLQLIGGGDRALASKATYLASLLPGQAGALQALKAAHATGEPLLKVAAAAALRNLQADAAGEMFEVLHADADAGVRKVALRSAVGLSGPRVQQRMRQLAQDDPVPFVRALAAQVADKR
jgi:hypothetical protein